MKGLREGGYGWTGQEGRGREAGNGEAERGEARNGEAAQGEAGNREAKTGEAGNGDWRGRDQLIGWEWRG